MTIRVSGGGKIDVHVTCKDRVPDLLQGFSDNVRRRARRWLHWPRSYERKVWRETKGMPRWARETVRQHLLHQRADRINARLQKLAERRHKRAQMTAVVVSATRTVVEAVPRVVATARTLADATFRAAAAVRPAPEAARQTTTSKPVPEVRAAVETTPEVGKAPDVQVAPPPKVGGLRHAAGTAWSGPTRGSLSITQRLALEHGIEPVRPSESRNILHHGRGR
jgi:hypothetical protein